MVLMVFARKSGNANNVARSGLAVEPSAPPLGENDCYLLYTSQATSSESSIPSPSAPFYNGNDAGRIKNVPIYEQIDGPRLGNNNFVRKYSESASSSSLSSSLSNINQSGAIISDRHRTDIISAYAIGRHAARFELNSIRFKQSPKKAMKQRINPILLTRRRCTDVFCGTLFAIFLAGWVAVAFIAMTWGRPERLIHPSDSRGRICGHHRPGAYDLRSRPYLLFFDLTKCASYVTVLTGCPTRQTCVSKCPTNYFSYLQLQQVRSDAEFHIGVQERVICDDSVDKRRITNFQELRGFVSRGLCTAYTVNSAAVVGRCIPQAFVDVAKHLDSPPHYANYSLDGLITALGNDRGIVPSDKKLRDAGGDVMNGIANSGTLVEKIAADLSVSWWQIISFWAISAAVCLLYAILLRLMGGAMIWLSIFVLLAFLGCGVTFSWIHYKHLIDIGAVNDFSFQPVPEVYLEMPTTWLVLGIAFSVLFVVVLLIFIFVHSRIRLAVALIEETSRALGNMLSTLFFPFFPFLLHLCIFALWGSVTIWLSSSGEENCRRTNPANPMDLENGERCDCKLLGTSTEPHCHYVNITRNNNHVMALQAYNLFALFWASGFVSALSDITIAGAFASHYFAFRKPHDLPSFPILRSLGRAIRYHVGTLAFGALILSIVKFMQVILDFLYNHLKEAENTVLKIIYRVLSCFFYCLEAFLRFLSRNAYIMTAIYGKGFFRSARDAFNLLTRNVVRVLVLGRTTAFLLFIGKASITCGMGALSYYYFSGKWEIDGFPQVYLYYEFVPISAVIIGTYFVCDLFLEVYDMGVDTTFLCFLEDCETNDGSVEKPFYMSDNLKKILGKENKF